ncbi:MAG: DUF1731 domain-containing protein, partial [Planctomycetes bacterium]|nr:DUF1731 domain-containing protein [Planctomycetota bacterium]
EVAQLLTDSQRCRAEKALSTGFQFEYPDLPAALKALLKK